MPSKNRTEIEPVPKRHAACDECRTRKLRCSGEYPSCARCVRDRVHCVYSPQKTMGRPRKRQRPDDESEVKGEDGRIRYGSIESDGKRNHRYTETTLDLSDTIPTTAAAAAAMNYGFTSGGMGGLGWDNLGFADVQPDVSKMFGDTAFSGMDTGLPALSNTPSFCGSPYGGPPPNLFENFDFGALYSSDAVPCHDFGGSSMGSSTVQKLGTPMATTPPPQVPQQQQQHQTHQQQLQTSAPIYPFVGKNTCSNYSPPPTAMSRKQSSPPAQYRKHSPPPKSTTTTTTTTIATSTSTIPTTLPSQRSEPLFTSPPPDTVSCDSIPKCTGGIPFPIGDGLSCECLTSFYHAVKMLKQILHNPVHLSPPTPTNDPPPPITLDTMLTASRTALNVARDALACTECRMCFTTVMNLGQLLPCLLALYSRCKDASEAVSGPTPINASLLNHHNHNDSNNNHSSNNSTTRTIIDKDNSSSPSPNNNILASSPSPSIPSISRPVTPESFTLVQPHIYRLVAERTIKGEVDRLLVLLGIMEVRSLARHGLTVTTELTREMVGRGVAELTANGNWKGERQPLCLKIVTTVRGMVDGLQSGVPVGACKRVKVEGVV